MRNPNSTHCGNGHEYTLENTYKHPITNHRTCKNCRKISHDKYKNLNYNGKSNTRAIHLKRRYGMTIEQYDEMYEKQKRMLRYMWKKC
jgi:hypothetical protein